MSGIIAEDGNEYTTHYYQRLNELVTINANKSSVPSVTGTTASGVDGQYFHSRGQHEKGTLTSQQFYHKPSNEDSRQFQAGMFSSRASNSSIFTGVSDESVFKKPLPLKRFVCRPLFREKFKLYMDFLCALDNKHTTKFAMRTVEALVCSIKKHSTPPAQPVNPLYLMDYISNTVKEEYLSKQVSKSICGSSIMSDQASNSDQCTISERSIRLDRPTVSSVPLEPRIALQDITQSSFYRGQVNKPPQDLPNSELSSITSIPGHLSTHLQNTSAASVASKQRGRPPRGQQQLETENLLNLLNDSEIARRRDEAALRHESMSLEIVPPKKSGKTLPKPTPRPPSSKKVRNPTKASTAVSKKPNNQHFMEPAPVPEKCNSDQTKKNMSLLNGTATSVSRCGRIRKAPVKYWNSKGEELSYTEPDESVFDESMTLRNKKVVNKKKTSPGSNKNDTSLVPIPENKTAKPSGTKPRGRPGHSSLSAEKENTESGKKKLLKKQNDTTVQSDTLSKGKTNKKNEVVKKNKENAEKKAAPKRKSKESNALAYKKKKIEDPVDYAPCDDAEDDLFGCVTYKRPTYQALKVAVSPSVGILSAKKAAGAAEGKATPPCKAIGDMMMNESIHSLMSATKEAPKQNQAIKRVIKKLEKNKMEPAKVRAKKTVKENEKSTFYVNNPMCSATLTVFSGADQNSDPSDMEEEDDDDDLM